MSADNIVYVQKKYGYFHVWEDSASVKPNYKDGYGHKKFKERLQALEYAHDYVLERGYMEYGVCEI